MDIDQLVARYGLDADRLRNTFEGAGWQYADAYLIERGVPDDDRRAFNAMLWAISPRNPNRAATAKATTPVSDRLDAERQAVLARLASKPAPPPTRPTPRTESADAAVPVTPGQAEHPGRAAATDLWGKAIANLNGAGA